MIYFLKIIIIICYYNYSANANDQIIIQSTTSTKNSGLYNYILPMIKKELGFNVRVVAVGTGAAIKNVRNCDGDVLLVHSKKREKKIVTDGFAYKRHDLMYNDFVLIGPSIDPAGVNKLKSIVDSFKIISRKKILFVSRGDESGTHNKEQTIWRQSGINPKEYSGKWYLETGSGMGGTINIAIGKGGYTLTDRATWIKFGNKQDFKIHIQNDKLLINQYGIMLINKLKCPRVRETLGSLFVNWMISKKGQKAINSYKINGKQLFFANAK